MKNKDFVYKVVNGVRTSYASEEGSKYCLNYPKGGIVEAVPSTVGLMCFKKKKDAKRFLNRDFYNITFGYFMAKFLCAILTNFSDPKDRFNYPRIIKVKPLSEEIDVRLISTRFSSYGIDEFYRKESSEFNTRVPPKGTVCYDKVKVLT